MGGTVGVVTPRGRAVARPMPREAPVIRTARDMPTACHAMIIGLEQVRVELVFDKVLPHGDGGALVERQSWHHDQA